MVSRGSSCDDLTPSSLRRSPAPKARWPFVSPDGAWIGFFRDAKIYKIATVGGDALALCDVRGGPGATWDDRGRIIFARTWLSGLSAVSADGGTPVRLTTPDAGQREIGHWWPSLLPGGKILFTIVTAGTGLNDAKIGLLDPASGRYRVLIPGARAAWVPSGHIVFFRTGRYQVVPFDLASVEVTGEASPVLADAEELDPAVTGRSRSPSHPTALSRTSKDQTGAKYRTVTRNCSTRSPCYQCRTRSSRGWKVLAGAQHFSRLRAPPEDRL